MQKRNIKCSEPSCYPLLDHQIDFIAWLQIQTKSLGLTFCKCIFIYSDSLLPSICLAQILKMVWQTPLVTSFFHPHLGFTSVYLQSTHWRILRRTVPATPSIVATDEAHVVSPQHSAVAVLTNAERNARKDGAPIPRHD